MTIIKVSSYIYNGRIQNNKVCFICIYIYTGVYIIQLVGPLKALYTIPHGRPVHSGTNLTSLRSILAMQQSRAKNIQSGMEPWRE